MDTILLTIEENIAWITLSRPDKYNAVNRDLALTLQEALIVARDNEEVRAIYLTGIGKAFCTGQDITEIVDPEGPDVTKIVGDHFNPSRSWRCRPPPSTGCWAWRTRWGLRWLPTRSR